MIEHVIDCQTGQGVDRDFEGVLPQPGETFITEGASLIPDPQQVARDARRLEALARLRQLALTDEVVADLLLVMGVE